MSAKIYNIVIAVIVNTQMYSYSKAEKSNVYNFLIEN